LPDAALGSDAGLGRRGDGDIEIVQGQPKRDGHRRDGKKLWRSRSPGFDAANGIDRDVREACDYLS
jgi:hypothetical protein